MQDSVGLSYAYILLMPRHLYLTIKNDTEVCKKREWMPLNVISRSKPPKQDAGSTYTDWSLLVVVLVGAKWLL